MTCSVMYEWAEAARWRGIDDTAFDAMDAESKARLIAHWRCATQLDAVLAKEQQRKANRQQKGGA